MYMLFGAGRVHWHGQGQGIHLQCPIAGGHSRPTLPGPLPPHRRRSSGGVCSSSNRLAVRGGRANTGPAGRAQPYHGLLRGRREARAGVAAPLVDSWRRCATNHAFANVQYTSCTMWYPVCIWYGVTQVGTRTLTPHAVMRRLQLRCVPACMQSPFTVLDNCRVDSLQLPQCMYCLPLQRSPSVHSSIGQNTYTYLCNIA